jgi:PPOX class probable F420-dependent enzyme
MASLTIPASHRDLLERQIPVALVTLSASGHPQATYIWAIPDGDTVLMSFPSTRQKAKNLRLDPRATIFAGDPQDPTRSLEIRGEVSLEPDTRLTTLKRILLAYETSLDSFKGPSEHRVTAVLRPSRIIAQG